MPEHAQSLVVDHPDTALHTARSYMDQRVLAYIEQNLKQHFGPLDSARQHRYLKLSEHLTAQQSTLTQSLAACMQSFEREGVHRLQQTLAPLAREHIDPRTWYFHTRIVEMPIRDRRDLSGNTPRQRVQSFTLWDAARLDLSNTYPPSYQNNYLEHSYISRHPHGAKEHPDVLSAATFEQHAHRLDLGADLDTRLDGVMNADFHAQLIDYHASLFEIAGFDAVRQPQENGIALPDLPTISQTFNDAAQPWIRCNLTFSGNSIPLPFFIRQFATLGNHRTVSYFPNRPGGALRRHFSNHDAIDSIIEQIRANPTDGWLLASLKEKDQATLRKHLNTPAVDRNDLNWAASLLFAAFGDSKTPRQKLTISTGTQHGSLGENLVALQTSNLRSDLSSMAATLNERRYKSLADAASIVLRETLELLTLPVPGGVTGLNRLMLASTLGSLAYQTINASIALGHEERTAFIQALGDLSDLAISARLQGLGATLSRRRTRQLIKSLGNPTVTRQVNGQLNLNWSDSGPVSDGLTPNDQQTSDLSDAQMLQRLLPEGLAGVDAHRAQWLLNLAGIQRSQLEAIWHAESTPPWQLLEVLQQELSDFKPEFPADTGALSRRFSELSPAAREHLLVQHPALRVLSDENLIAPDAMASILQVQAEQRVIQSVHRFAAPSSVPPHADSEALLCDLLVSRPDWPQSLGIRIFSGITDFGGQITATSTRLAHYGLESAQTFIDLYRAPTGYAGTFHTGDLIQVDPGQSGLAQAILRTLDDEQRRTIGFDIFASSTLIAALERQALDSRPDLAELLPQANTYSLSASRLSAFRQPLPLTDVARNEEGIVPFDGKCYALIEGSAYQVLRDPQASSPDQTVWRIVRPEDPVAAAPDNQYHASRPGRSEPVTLDAQGQWQGVLVGGLGGSGRGRGRKLAQMRAQNERIAKDLDALADKIDRFTTLMPMIITVSSRPGAKRDTARQKYNEFIDHLNQYKALLEQHREHVIGLRSQAVYKASYHMTLAKLIIALNHLGLFFNLDMHDQLDANSLDIERGLDIVEALSAPHLFSDYRRARHIVLQGYINRLAPQIRRDHLLEQLDQSVLPAIEQQQVAEIAQSHTHYQVRIGMVSLRCQLLSVSDTHAPLAPAQLNPHVMHLANSFVQAAVLLIDVAQSPTDKQFALLAHVQERLDGVIHGLTHLKEGHPVSELNRDAQHLEECIQGVEFFRDYSLERLQALLNKNEGEIVPSTDLDGIDIEYLPQQPSNPSRPQPPARRKRIIAIKHHGNYRLALAEQHGDDADKLVLVDPSKGAAPRHVERMREGGWQETVASPERTLGQLGNASVQSLRDIEQLIQQAKALAVGNDAVAANVYEPLLNRADRLDALITGFDKQATSAPLEEKWLTQRQALADQSNRLRGLANELTLQIYKNLNKPNASYLTNLIRLQQVKVRKVNNARILLGKGSKRHFLDNYLIMDLQNQPLWEAHFHYPDANTPRERFAHGSGHLKTLEDARKGIEYQRRQAQQGLEVRSILRAEVSTSLASALFGLADKHGD
ncbi:hypothetical protein N5D52_20085 [Pseudomonas sp. GD03860]|uniref:hypothetical protein n=1 Tax=Pseudomonas TaxID=286 RepID=UPI002363873F|nr:MULTISPECIES: hypothetical protein [Pseudomonas]MDD2056037.1 hypothetical protein [Pseudomonas putida]MDH0639235.1 hypothetical protein [Pseudomonas sp. GD03860]